MVAGHDTGNGAPTDGNPRMKDGAWRIRHNGKVAGYVYCYEAGGGAIAPTMIEHWFMVVDVPAGNNSHIVFDPRAEWSFEPLEVDGVAHHRGTVSDPTPPPRTIGAKPTYQRVTVSSRGVNAPFEW